MESRGVHPRNVSTAGLPTQGGSGATRHALPLMKLHETMTCPTTAPRATYATIRLVQALGEPDVALVPLAAPPPGNTLIPKILLDDSVAQQKVAQKLLKLRRRALRDRLSQRISSEKPVEAVQVDGIPERQG